MKKGIVILIVLLASLVGFFGNIAQAGKRERPVKMPAHYIVFELKDGQVRPMARKLVNAYVESRSEGKIEDFLASGEEEEIFEISAFSGQQEMIFSDLARVPVFTRVEFPNESGVLEDHSFIPERHYFVTRVPQEAIKVSLKTRWPKSTPIGQQAQALVEAKVFEFDLSEIRPISGGQSESLFEAPEILETDDIIVLMDNGDSANRVDLLILGDGYRSEEREKFISDVMALFENFFDITPYKEYRNFVNVKALFIPSRESGADHPPYNPNCTATDNSCCREEPAKYDTKAPKFVDTALGSSYCWGGYTHRALVSNIQLVLSAASAVPDWDRIMVLVNDDTWGGTGGYISTFAVNYGLVGVAQHEHGHSFTGLSDEYDYGCFENCLSWCPYENDSYNLNVTCKTSREEIKWYPWILATTPIPTPWDWNNWQFENVVGLFEGAMYTTKGIYRPYARCMMRDLSEFCPVCRQEYVRKLYGGWWNGVPKDGIDLIEPGSENPAPGNVLAQIGQAVNLTADFLRPVGSEIDIGWYIDGVAAEGAKSNIFSFVSTKPITKVELKVKDKTLLVHQTMGKGLLEHSRAWQIIADSVPAPAVSGQTAGVIGKFYQFSITGQKCMFGHGVQFLLDWGDGTNSGWLATGIIGMSKSWSAPGTYIVKAKARCSVYQDVVSEWSAICQIKIQADFVSAPAIVSGPAGGIIGKMYSFGATVQKSQLDHDVQLLFDWGDGTDSGWLAVGITSATKSWSVPLAYNVRAKIRCSICREIVSDWSTVKQMVITLPKLDVSVMITGRSGKPKKITVSVKGADTGQIITDAKVVFSGLTNQVFSSDSKGKVIVKKIIGQGSLKIRVTKPGYEVWEETF